MLTLQCNDYVLSQQTYVQNNWLYSKQRNLLLIKSNLIGEDFHCLEKDGRRGKGNSTIGHTLWETNWIFSTSYFVGIFLWTLLTLGDAKQLSRSLPDQFWNVVHVPVWWSSSKCIRLPFGLRRWSNNKSLWIERRRPLKRRMFEREGPLHFFQGETFEACRTLALVTVTFVEISEGEETSSRMRDISQVCRGALAFKSAKFCSPHDCAKYRK